MNRWYAPATAVACLLWLCSCAVFQPVKRVQPGDVINVNYTCRSEDGQLMATTEKTAAQDQKTPRSPIFRMPEAFAPVTLVAGAEAANASEPQKPVKLSGFKKVLHKHLAMDLAGQRYGQPEPLRLSPHQTDLLPPAQGYVTFAKVWARPKQSIIPVDRFVKMMRRQPEVGFQYDHEMGLQATVANVGKRHVTIQYAPVNGLGCSVPTQFGTGIVKDGGTKWRIDMQVVEGQLVRSRDLVGRVVKVEPTMFYVDYGHPFGGGDLICDVAVDAAQGQH